MLKKIVVNQHTQINYYQGGQGQPLLLLHGLNNNWQGWEQIIYYLKKDYTIYAIDCPGWGDSDNLQHYSPQIIAKHIAFFVQALKIKPVVIGTSLGSWIGAVFCLKYPRLIKKCVLIGAPIIRKSFLVPWHFQLYSFILKHQRLHSPYLKTVKSKTYGYLTAKYVNMYHFDKKIVDRYGMAGKQKTRSKPMLETFVKAYYQIKLENIIPKIKVPTLLIWGRNDKCVDMPTIAKMTKKLNQAKFQVFFLPECGHVVHFEKPKEASCLIKNFLKK